MSCNCYNNSSDSKLRVTRGNDFTFVVNLQQWTLTDDGGSELIDFDLSTCTDIKASLVTRLGKRTALEPTVEGSKVKFRFEETLACGDYGIEIKGKKANGDDWRFYAKPGEAFRIVEATSESSAGEGSIDGTVGEMVAADGKYFIPIPDVAKICEEIYGSPAATIVDPDDDDPEGAASNTMTQEEVLQIYGEVSTEDTTESSTEETAG